MNVVPLTTTTRDTATSSGLRQLDDLIRRKLKVGDPSNVQEVTRALRVMYPKTAASSDAEARGFSPLSGALTSAPVELGLSQNDDLYEETLAQLREDLGVLVKAANNRDIDAELRGYEMELPRELSAAVAAARLSLDPAQRDAALLGILRLNERAHELRQLGLRSSQSFFDYRRAATTADTAADVVRVAIGEALGKRNLGRQGWIVNAPAADLQARGRALVDSLDELAGQDACCHDNEQGQNFRDNTALVTGVPASLRGYVRPRSLDVAITELVGVYTSGMASPNGEGLRQGSLLNSQTIVRLGQLYGAVGAVIAGMPPNARQPLRAFGEALGLFLSAFVNTRAGALYIELALPVTLSARRLGTTRLARRTSFRNLIIQRSNFAFTTESMISNNWYQGGRLSWVARRDGILLNVHRTVDMLA